MGTHHFKDLVALWADLDPEFQCRGVTGFVVLCYQMINFPLFKK